MFKTLEYQISIHFEKINYKILGIFNKSMLFLSTKILQTTNNLDIIDLPYKHPTPKQIPEI